MQLQRKIVQDLGAPQNGDMTKFSASSFNGKVTNAFLVHMYLFVKGH